MDSSSRALVSSFLAKGISAILAIIGVPLYVEYIGVESYGVVGAFTSLTVLLGLLDFGFGPSIIKEFSSLNNSKENIRCKRESLVSFEVVYWLLSICFIILFFFSSRYIAENWLNSNRLSVNSIANGIKLAGLAFGIVWSSTLYSSGLIGLQKQSSLSYITIIIACLRLLLTWLLLSLYPNLETFFLSQVVINMLQTILLRYVLFTLLQTDLLIERFNFNVIRKTFNFAKGMAGIGFTTIVLTQTDKIILGKLLDLSSFGIYSVSHTLASGVYLFVSPIFAIIFPKFSSFQGSNNKFEMQNLFLNYSQLISFLVIPITSLIYVYAELILEIWTRDNLISSRGFWILRFLILGNAINGIMNVPYALQLSHGWTKLTFNFNLLSILIFILCLFYLTPIYGAEGAAFSWFFINILSIFFIPYIVINKLLNKAYWKWIFKTVLIPMGVSFLVLLIFDTFILIENHTSFVILILLATCWGIIVLSLIIALPDLRKNIIKNFTHIFLYND